MKQSLSLIHARPTVPPKIIDQPFRSLPQKQQLPYALYGVAQIQALEQAAINDFGIAADTLMERAGAAAFALLRTRWPAVDRLTLLCGLGKNAGDAYVVARLAQNAGLKVMLIAPEGIDALPALAAEKARACLALGLELHGALPAQQNPGVIVDGLFGTGLNRAPTGRFADLIATVNALRVPVLALDVPSGLAADTGTVLGCAIRADVTVTFVGLKQGLFTGAGPAYSGEVVFANLDLPALLYAREVLSARRIDWQREREQLMPLARIVHKGQRGHLLLLGGAPGLHGALLLAAEAGLRAGTGLVTLASCAETIAASLVRHAEIMTRLVMCADDVLPALARATALVVGPGLGRDDWARQLFASALASDKPLVLDADALHVLAEHPVRAERWILTPHPGEAAALLGCSVEEIQADRFAAVERLQQRYGGVVILKGAGTLIAGGDHRPVALCSDGNPGMATAGMGDVLAGITGGLLAQGYAAADAAAMAVTLHAAAADRAAQEGMRSLIASDLFASMRTLLG